MANPTVTYFSNLVPPGVYPPASVRWVYFSTTIPPGVATWVVPWQPGTPPGVLVPISWLVTDIFFRVENASSSAISTLTIQRSTSAGPFVAVNNINDVPITIPIGLNEAVGRPYTPATIDNPLVNSGDKLEAVITLGAGASLVSFYVVLVQVQGI